MTDTPDKTSAPELNPCPFCGSGPATIRQNASFSGTELLRDYYHKFWWVNCGTCGAAGPREPTGAEAIAAWNRRADAIPLSAALAHPEVRALVAERDALLAERDALLAAAEKLADECQRLRPVICDAIENRGAGERYGIATTNAFETRLNDLARLGTARRG
jgi:Lar family restriction alleviation protein